APRTARATSSSRASRGVASDRQLLAPRLSRREVEARGDVLALEVRMVGEDFVVAHPSGEQLEHVRDGDAEPANRRAAAAEARDESDAAFGHRWSLADPPAMVVPRADPTHFRARRERAAG